jgi:VWFA-related protein
MPRIVFGFFLTASLCAPAYAAGQTAAKEPPSAIRTNANLVVVDVVVSDAQHRPVHKLTAADFTVFENGQAQSIKTFEEHTSSDATMELPSLPKLPPGTFTNFSIAPENGALNILLLDALNTPLKDQMVVRDQMLKYLKEAPPRTRMAIVGLTTRLELLQGFTSDPELIRAVLNGKKGNAKGSVVMNDAVNGDNPGADDPMMDATEDAAAGLGNSPAAAMLVADFQQFEAETQSFQLQVRARYTLDALKQLGRYLSTLPGRKNLIWFSGSFPIDILPDGDLENPFIVVASAEDEFRETTEILARSQVAVYPIDARGLMALPMLDASNSAGRYATTPSAFAKDSAKFLQQNAGEHGTMQAMAEATGGEAFVDTNGLKEAVEEAINAGSNYYTLSYTPTNQQWKGEYRKIQINAGRPGLTLVYRRGYYADDPNAPPRRGEPPIPGNGHAPYDAMRAAMMRGGPDPTEITFAVTVRPSIAGTEAELAPGNRSVGKTKGPYRRYTVLFGISAHDAACEATADGIHHCDVESMIFVYDADGNLRNTQTTGMKADLPADRYATLLQSGIRLRQEISVPVKGDFFLRIGVHDQATDRVGAVEFPISAVSKLPPLFATEPK